jgi:hypothetical protein
MFKLDMHSFFGKVTFYVKKTKNYQVWVYYPFLKIYCTSFSTFKDAKIYINKSLKTVLREKFLFRICFNCDTKNYYPIKYCSSCREYIFPDIWEIDEKENENKPEHLGLTKNVFPRKRCQGSFFYFNQ